MSNPLPPKRHRDWAITYLIDDKPPAKTTIVEAASLACALSRFSEEIYPNEVEWPSELDVLSVTLQPGK